MFKKQKKCHYDFENSHINPCTQSTKVLNALKEIFHSVSMPLQTFFRGTYESTRMAASIL